MTLTVGIPKKISYIEFGLLSPDEIRKMSATKIITADTYDDDGFPIALGLMDQHLGIVEPGLRCKTCGRRVNECPGHFGHIDLAMPIIHVGFVKNIKNFLKSTCRVCGRILLSEEQIKHYMDRIKKVEEGRGEDYFSSNEYMAMVSEIFKETGSTLNCPHCGEVQKKITLDKPTTFREDGHKLIPSEVRARLERIDNSDLVLLGVNPKVARPEWMVLTVLPVPPVNVRPSITLESGDRSEDDLTHKLVDIIRINQRLLENRDAGAPQLIVEDLWELLQYHVTTYFDNQTSGIPPARHRSGRPLKTLVQRLKGKEGRFRSNLSGKRVNFSSRTVISPDPYISINEVGVPMKAAKEITVPIRVTPYNLEEMQELVRRGPDNYPGVNYVIRPDKRRLKVTERNAEKIAEELREGYIVERQLVNGDIVLFNRQPSLHRMSMMAHLVRVMPNKTFRLNLSVCPPYNADFDGDEMNLHVLQGVEARAEAKTLMLVQEHIMSPRFGGPIIGAIHDHISGSFLATVLGRVFTRAEALHIISAVDHRIELPPPEIVDNGREYWTGKQLFSLVIPDDITMTYKAAVCEKCTIREVEDEGPLMDLSLKDKELIGRDDKWRHGFIEAIARKNLPLDENAFVTTKEGEWEVGDGARVYVIKENKKRRKLEVFRRNVIERPYCIDKEAVKKALAVYNKETNNGKKAATPETYKKMRDAVKGLCPVDAFVFIHNGNIISGVMDEKSIGSFKGKLIDIILREKGTDAAREFLDKVTKLAVYAITTIGFTTGIDDEDIPEDAKKDISDLAQKSMARVGELVDEYMSGKMEAEPGHSLEDTLEMKVMRVLGRARDEAGNIASRYLGLENSAVIMAKSGARGSMLNLSQMSGLIGQQSVRGERIRRGYYKRTLPHFQRDDLGAKAKGFVKASYKIGMSPTEYFFHAIGGREGLVDTAVRTSRSGYMQRRLINALEDLKVTADGTVRNTSDTIIQFLYGGDGIDPTRSERGDPVDLDTTALEVFGLEKVTSLEEEKDGVGEGYGLLEPDMLGFEVEGGEEESED